MFRFLFQAAFLCVVSLLCRHTTCPPTPQQHQLEYWAGICKRCSRARGWEGLGRVGRWGEGKEKGERKREGREEEIIWVLHHQHTLLLLLLPIVEPWGPGEAALCLAVMQPLYHPNLLIVGAQLAHGGFLLEPPNIKQAENVAKMLLLLFLLKGSERSHKDLWETTKQQKCIHSSCFVVNELKQWTHKLGEALGLLH